MKNSTIPKSISCNIPNGTIITGKWNKHSYTIIRQLGQGANGVVYLVRNINGVAAMKLSDSSTSISSEVNVLRRFLQVPTRLGPDLLDVDDWIYQNELTSFYVMEYIEGKKLTDFFDRRGYEWLGILMLQLLNNLQHLHEAGWAFGDLKPDNLLISNDKYPRLRLIDVGGTTLIGRSIKEFTEFFDRGYWLGETRRAEPSYDLFSTVMVMMNVCYPQKFSRDGDGRALLTQKIKSHPVLSKYESVLVKAINNQYISANQMKNELVKLIATFGEKPKRQQQVLRPNRSRKIVKKRSGIALLETMAVAATVLGGYILYVYSQLM